MPRVSVVIPSYNRPEFLLEAIENVQQQTYRDLEILVVDSSTDDTSERFRSPMDRVRWVHQPRQGRSAAKNLGLILAKGEFVAFMDCDDLWDPTKIQRQVELFECDSDVGFTYTNQYKQRADGTRYVRTRADRIVSGQIHDAILRKQVYLSTSTICIRKKCIELAGMFDSSLAEQEDWDFPLRLSRYFKGAGIKEPLVTKRTRGDERSDAEFSMLRIRAMRDVLKRDRKDFTIRNLLRRRAVQAGYHCSWGRTCFQAGRVADAFREFALALLNNPFRLDAVVYAGASFLGIWRHDTAYRLMRLPSALRMRCERACAKETKTSTSSLVRSDPGSVKGDAGAIRV